MLTFRNHRWLCIPGRTRFHAHISAEGQPNEVFWMLDLDYVAGGAVWRRVNHSHRPRFHLDVASFALPAHGWENLAQLDFWNGDEDDPITQMRRGGWVNTHYDSKQPGHACENGLALGYLWRVAGREDRWFTAELAGVADGTGFLDALPVKVLPDGTEERAEPDAEFWKANAQVYLVEQVPFGTVHVQVPRNAKDPLNFALTRAQQTIGVGQPEHFEVNDFAGRGEHRPYQDDLMVTLHFGGFYED